MQAKQRLLGHSSVQQHRTENTTVGNADRATPATSKKREEPQAKGFHASSSFGKADAAAETDASNHFDLMPLHRPFI